MQERPLEKIVASENGGNARREYTARWQAAAAQPTLTWAHADAATADRARFTHASKRRNRIVIERLTRTARKLRGRGLGELRERGAQALAAWRERSGLLGADLAVDERSLVRRLAPGSSMDAAALLRAFRTREARFFPVFDDPPATVVTLAHVCPQDRAAVLARAERVLANRFALLGYDELSYGDPIDWHRDPVRGLRAPDRHWSRVPYLNAAVVGDHKVTWEVNRQQYLVVLGQAYWYTRDERYARTFAEHVTAWMDANGPKHGINWASSLEVAFRAMAWTWALHFFRDAPSLTPALYARLLAYLHVHARHLERYLSTYFSPNTHLTGEALGLVFVGTCFPELAGATRWLDLGLDVLKTWLPRQVRADGGYFEQATQYHRYTTEFTLQLLILSDRHAWRLEDALQPVLARLLDYLRAVTRPDGTIPLIGDDDGGKLVDLDGRPPHDVRGVFAQAAAWFGSAEVGVPASRTPAARAAAVWLVGASASRLHEERAPYVASSHAFRDTGTFVLCSGAGTDAMHAVFDCGPHGAMNAGHAHADVLALVASAGGRDLLVDSGTYSYPGQERNAFRGADAHNALLVDGEGSSVPAVGAFQWQHVANGTLVEWGEHARFTFVEGTHDGFTRLPDPVTHHRAVLLLPGVGWVVRDRVTARTTHVLRTLWHLAPNLDASVTAPDRARGLGASATAFVRDTTENAPCAALHVVVFGSRDAGGMLITEPAWISPRYGARVPSTRLVFEQQATGAQEIITLLLPAGSGRVLHHVRELTCDGDARAFLLEIDGADLSASAERERYVLVLGGGGWWCVGDPDCVSADRVSADCTADTADTSAPWFEGDTQWTWLVHAREPVEQAADLEYHTRYTAARAGAGHGSSLHHQGRAILRPGDAVHARRWMTAVRRGTEWLDDGPPHDAAVD